MHDKLTQAIAADLGISDLPPKEQEAVIAQFGEVALKAATLAVVNKLAADKRDIFAGLAAKGDAQAVQEFLAREVPDHEEIAKAAVEVEVKRFKDFQKP